MTSRSRRSRAAGFTLLELLVVIAIVAVGALAGGLAMRTAAPGRRPSDVYARIATLRHQAVERGTPVTGVVVDSAGTHAVTAQPDGSVLTDAPLRIDRRNGRRADDAP